MTGRLPAGMARFLLAAAILAAAILISAWLPASAGESARSVNGGGTAGATPSDSGQRPANGALFEKLAPATRAGGRARPMAQDSPETATEPSAAPPATLSAAEIEAEVIGNTVSGDMGSPFTEFYAPDGTVRGVGRDGPYEGSWSIRDDMLCLAYEQPFGCRSIALENGRISYITRSGETDGTGTLIPGNPNDF